MEAPIGLNSRRKKENSSSRLLKFPGKNDVVFVETNLGVNTIETPTNV